MKKSGHPEYQQTLFIDSSTGHKFVCGSTVKSQAKESFQGKEYPVVRVSTSSSSHPFFTGSKQLVDAEGRVDKFKKRYATAAAKKEEEPKKDSDSKEDKSKEDKKKSAKPAAKTAKK